MFDSRLSLMLTVFYIIFNFFLKILILKLRCVCWFLHTNELLKCNNLPKINT